jgi:membrane-associated phospholipid phosphatase
VAGSDGPEVQTLRGRQDWRFDGLARRIDRFRRCRRADAAGGGDADLAPALRFSCSAAVGPRARLVRWPHRIVEDCLYGCPPAGDMHSPSGHTSLSTLVYGALTLVAATASPGLRRLLVIGGGAGLILAIAVSRLLLDAHSTPEVGLGLLVGAVSLALFSRQYLEGPNKEVWPLLVTAGVLMSILHGRELHAEQFLHRITGYLQVHCG